MVSSLISHADKVLFAERGDTKGDLAEHYERVEPVMMRAVRIRQAVFQRVLAGKKRDDR